MEFTMIIGASKEELLSISRVRDLLYAIFVSDIVTVDGKHLEKLATATVEGSFQLMQLFVQLSK